MTGIPLVNSNSVNDINTSIIAIKKEMKSSGETEVNVNVNLPDTAIPVDEVTSGNMHSVTSNAVASALSYSTTEVNTGRKWIDGKTIYSKVLPNITFSTNVTKRVDVGANIDKGWIDLSKTVFHSTWFSSTRQLFSNSGMTDIFVKDNNSGADSNKVVFTTPFSDGSEFGGTTYIDIVVEYTKTTD